MKLLRGTLLSDGSSDRMLLPVIRWLLADLGVQATELRWANPGLFPQNTQGLGARARAAVDREPCDILFIHRDAEKIALNDRLSEIRDELNDFEKVIRYICIVPVRMSEAWFLINESAIRSAASNPNGMDTLDLPELKRIEALPDPKKTLAEALCTATCLKGRHLRRFKRELRKAILRVGEYINDYSLLRQLEAFRAFESDLAGIVADLSECNRNDEHR